MVEQSHEKSQNILKFRFSIDDTILSDIFQFDPSEIDTIDFKEGEMFSFSINLGGLFNKPLVTFKYTQEFGWFLVTGSVQPGFVIGVLLKNVSEFEEGLDSQEIEFRLGMSLKMGQTTLKLIE